MPTDPAENSAGEELPVPLAPPASSIISNPTTSKQASEDGPQLATKYDDSRSLKE